MTKNEFLSLCGEYSVDAGIALENEAICYALKVGDRAVVESILATEF